jgi:hypothetical protein
MTTEEVLLLISRMLCLRLLLLLLLLVVVVISARIQGSSCTAAISLIVHPVFYKFPLSPPDASTTYATREIRAARGGTLMGGKM